MDNLGSISQFKGVIASIFLNLSFLLVFLIYSYNHVVINHSSSSSIPTLSGSRNSIFLKGTETEDCSGVHNFTDFNSKCLYVKSHSSCMGKGFINYLEIFYCSFGQFPVMGYSLLLLWLVILFYLVGNTTAAYFVPSVEGLSTVLKLSPTISGTTLLPFGNGANDVFASVISFTKSHDADVGFNSVLGGAFFISCFVVGIVAITVSSRQTKVNEANFVRDVLFLILALLFLLMIIIFGRINLSVAIGFVSLYFAYIGVVSSMHFFYPPEKEKFVNNPSFASPSPRRSFSEHSYDEVGDIGIPLMGYVDEEKSGLPKTDSSQVSDQIPRTRLLGFDANHFPYLNFILSVLVFPLYLPRRMTIPVVNEEKWSKTFAVSSAILAPVMLAAVWNSQIENLSSKIRLPIYMTAGLLGLILGNLTIAFTKMSSPPKECLLPWLAGGFLMSVTWTYVIVEELVSLLVSFGTIFEISPSLLGLTVLAWGNSLGDFISNVTMALNDGPGGTQIAMSGCYAGPLFNTLIGLGLSLVLSTWKEYPSSYMIPKDPYLYETVGFLIAGLLWALVILLKKNMQLDRSLGGGLLAIYMCFLFLTFAKALGLLNVDGSFITKLKQVGQ